MSKFEYSSDNVIKLIGQSQSQWTAHQWAKLFSNGGPECEGTKLACVMSDMWRGGLLERVRLDKKQRPKGEQSLYAYYYARPSEHVIRTRRAQRAAKARKKAAAKPAKVVVTSTDTLLALVAQLEQITTDIQDAMVVVGDELDECRELKEKLATMMGGK